MRYSLFIICYFTLIVFIISSCHEIPKDDGSTYHKEYVIGSISSTDNFSTLNENEEAIDSMFSSDDVSEDSLLAADPKYKELAQKRKFTNNRSRLFLVTYTDGQPGRGDSVLSAPCNCLVEKDTLFIRMALGFFGGFIIDIKLYKTMFETRYLVYTNDVRHYKSDLSDTAFNNQAVAKSKFQFLLLDRQPTFKPGQQLNGYLTFTSRNHYRKSVADKMDTAYVTGKIYFTCHTSQEQINW
jgi:hypothetical protein